MAPVTAGVVNGNGNTAEGAMKACTGTIGAIARHVVPQPFRVPFLLL
jgi:hypothetical protein